MNDFERCSRSVGNRPRRWRNVAASSVVAVLIVTLFASVAQAQTTSRPQVTRPAKRAVIQRVDQGQTPVVIEGTNPSGSGSIEVRVVSRDALPAEPTAWVSARQDGSKFSTTISLSPGWFDVEVRTSDAPTQIVTHGPFGVGEVFIAAGQSNSANAGSVRTYAADDRISGLNIDAQVWTDGSDPQPSADGDRGSPWPTFASELAVALDMPVGIASVGIGGTAINTWDPRAPLGYTHYDRIQYALGLLGRNGVRAILWHQGEADINTDIFEYRDALEALIAQSRVDAGFDVPWGVAIVSNGVEDANVVKAQEAVISRDPLVFRGANTNDFRELGYIGRTVHFNYDGLVEHGHRWVTPTLGFFGFASPTPQRGDLDCSLGGPNYRDVIAGARVVVDLPIEGLSDRPFRCAASAGTDAQRCDVDRNNVCNMRDVLVIAQCEAGQEKACAILAS